MSAYVESVREARTSPTVLIAGIIKIRGRRPDDPIFIFEGVDDVGVYQEWLRTVSPNINFQCLPGQGKSQLLKLIDRFRADDIDLAWRVWFFLDRDFDYMRGRAPGSEVYVCERYSIENYLVSDRMVDEYLIDEFRCAPDVDIRTELIGKFEAFLGSLSASMSSMNSRLYIAKKSGIDVKNKKEKLGAILRIGLENSAFLGDVTEVVKLAREPTSSEIASHQAAFDRLICLEDFRGKWLFWAFRAWLDLVYEDRRSDKPRFFAECQKALGPSPRTMEMRQFASRCEPPYSLRGFMGGVQEAIS